MLAKTYLFLRDYMPRGLTGPYAHISGNMLMRYLLCGAYSSILCPLIASFLRGPLASLGTGSVGWGDNGSVVGRTKALVCMS